MNNFYFILMYNITTENRPNQRLQIDDLTQSDTFVTSTQTKTQNTA